MSYRSRRPKECYLSLAYNFPVDQGGVGMIFEDRLDLRVEGRILGGVAHEVAYHPDIVGIRQLYHGDYVGTCLTQRRMNRVPGPDPAV